MCNRYPDISVSTDLPSGADVAAGSKALLLVSLEREGGAAAAADGLMPVHAPRFPGRKDEGWWLVLGDPKANKLYAIKRVPPFGASARVKLEFEAPGAPGKASLQLFFMCDSWMGCDQEYEVELNVQEGEEEEDDEDQEMEDGGKQ